MQNHNTASPDESAFIDARSLHKELKPLLLFEFRRVTLETSIPVGFGDGFPIQQQTNRI